MVSRPYWLTRGLGRLSSFNRAVQSQLTTNVCGLPSGVWVYGDRVLSVHSHLLVQQRQPNWLPTRQRAACLEGQLGVLVRAVIPWYCRTWSCVFHGQRLRTVMVLVLSWYLTRNGTIVDAGIGVAVFIGLLPPLVGSWLNPASFGVGKCALSFYRHLFYVRGVFFSSLAFWFKQSVSIHRNHKLNKQLV